MWLAAFTAALLLGVASDRALGAPAPTRLDDDETRSFWKGWLLLDDPSLTPEDSGRKKGQITPKSVFIAPVIKDLPDCAPGYRADALGRCHRLVKIDQSAQLSFLLQKLNSMYANSDKFIKKSPQSTTEGPLQVAIPLFASVQTTPTPIITTSTTTEAPRTEEVEIVVVAAEVEVKDEENSTSIPGAIVTLWHLNTTNSTISNDTSTTPEVTESTITDELTTISVSTMEDTTTLPPSISTLEEDETTTSDISTLTTDDDSTSSTNTESTISEENTTMTETTQTDDNNTTEDTSITDELNSSTITETIPSFPPKRLTTPLPSTTTDISLLSVHKIDSDIKLVESSDLSSENTDDKPITLELPDLLEDSEITVVDTVPSKGHQLSWEPDGQRLRWPSSDDLNQRTPPPQQESGWSWGPWPTTQRPVYLNFWSNVPQIPDPTVRTRTVLRRPQTRYPSASFNGRPGPFFYRELSGQDVANVFRQSWRQG